MSYRPASRLAGIEPFHVVELFTRARRLEAIDFAPEAEVSEMSIPLTIVKEYIIL